MRWIVQTHRDKFNDELIEAVKSSGDNYYILTSATDFQLPPTWHQELPDKEAMFFGTIQTAKSIREKLHDYSPVVWLTEKNYLCSQYYSYFGDLLFNDRYAMVPVKELLRQKWFYYATFAKDALMFLRPDSGEKPFTGALVDMLDATRFLTDVSFKSPSELVVVSSPKTILGEWRFVVSSLGDIVSYSCYLYQGQFTPIPSAPQGAIDLCKEVIARGYHPDPMYCIDIAQDAEEKFYLLELNSFSCAGYYASNKKAILSYIKDRLPELK